MSASRAKHVKHVLVLGGAGYVGSVLVTRLLRAGYRVRVLDSLIFGRESLESVESHPGFQLMRGDVRDIGAVVRAMKECDAVIHLAGIVGDSACEENKELAVEVNRAATRMLADVARDSGIERFLFASSCSVYGASESIVDESSPLAPLSVYAQTKAESEKILLDARTRDFAPAVLRLGTLFGPSSRMRFDLVVNLLLARAVSTGRIVIFNGEQWRPFMHVQDAARAFAVCLESEVTLIAGEVFNAGTSQLNLQLKNLGDTLELLIPGVKTDRIQNGDKRNYRVSFAKIESQLGFCCRETLESGIRQMCRAMRSGSIKNFADAQFNNQIAVRALAEAGALECSPSQFLNTEPTTMVTPRRIHSGRPKTSTANA